MGRRGRGEGSIFRRKDGRWVAKLSLGGSRSKVFYGRTRGAVAQRLTAALKARQDGLPMPSGRRTTAAYLAGWLESVRPTLRPRTWIRYEQYIRLAAAPAIGHIQLSQLGPQHLQQLYSDRLSAGSSPTSVHHLHAVLHRALEQATRWGLVARNVASLVTPPQIGRHEMQTLSPDQARTFLASVAGTRLEALYVLAVSTGMRQGELLGLRWANVDLDSAVLQVRATLQRTRDGFVLVPPKTARSRRQVALTQAAVRALHAHRARQLEERLAVGPAWDDRDLVFCDAVGGPLHGTYMTKVFQVALARAGLPRLRFHDLRHTAATLLLGRGVHPKVASEMLGHATVSITLDVYSHVTMQRQAADALDAVLSGA